MEPEAAQQALANIGELYALEKRCREQNLSGEEKQKYRHKYCEPVVSQFFAWVYDQRQRVDYTILTHTNTWLMCCSA